MEVRSLSLFPLPGSAHAALPGWLPPWSDQGKRTASVTAACNGSPAAGYADAVLCANSGGVSDLLAAALGGQLASSCGDQCVYTPLSAAGAVPPAWRFDYDNQCWCVVCCVALA